MLKQKKFLIGGIVIFITVAFLAYTGFQNSSAYYYTVSEVLEQGSSVYGENLRVNGHVKGDTIKTDVSTLTLKFDITEGVQKIPVVYQGATPDNFQADIEVVVEGTLDTSGVFQANNIVTKCPSKYEAQG